MSITHEDLQRAKRISRAIQEYLEMVHMDGLRSTDVYPYLAKKGLIEQDRHNGLHLRKFLNKLRENDLLKLIPQCQWKPSDYSEMNEWYFYRIVKETSEDSNKIHSEPPPESIIIPSLTEKEIDEHISKYRPLVENLPKRTDKRYTPPEQDTRSNYARAFEYWTNVEINIMKEFYLLTKRVDKTAKLLDRQPSMVELRLRELKIIKD
jgi:hypothetical protein